MSRLRRALERIAPLLRSSGHDWAIVGGLAVAARASVRFTADLDLVVAVDSDEQAEILLRQLRLEGYEVHTALEHEHTARLAAVRLKPPGETAESLFVDLLFATSGIEREIIADSEVLGTGIGLQAPVARTGHLIAMKLLARDDRRRPADYDDLERLVAVADPDEIARARGGVRLISERGYARGRDLVADLERLIETRRPRDPGR